MFLKKLLPIVILCVAAHLPAFGDGQWTTYTNTNIIRCMAQQGEYIWCGTDGGVIRLDRRDGSQVKYTTLDGLIANSIRTIVVDEDGVVWAGSFAGASSFDGKAWKKYTKDNGLPDNNITAIAVDKNNVKWFGTDEKGLVSFDGETWTRYTVNGQNEFEVYSIAVDENNVKWIASYYVLLSFDGTTWSGTSMGSIKKVAVGPDGKIWISKGSMGGNGDTVYRLDENGFTPIVSYQDAEKLSYFYGLFIDRSGRVWFGNENAYVGGGHSVVLYDNGIISQYTTENGFPDIYALCFLQDEKDILWIGTSDGLFRFDGAQFQSFYGTRNAPDNSFLDATFSADGLLWLGTGSNGVAWSDGSTWHTKNEADGLAQNSVYSIAPDGRGGFWAATLRGVSRFDGVSWKTFTKADGLADDLIYSIAIDHDGVVWFGSDHGITRYDGSAFTKVSEDTVKDIAVDKHNTKWFAANAGVKQYDGISWTTYNITNGLNMSGTKTIAIGPDGTVWAGALGNIARFDGNTWNTWNSSGGLFHKDVRCIAVDQDGVAWIGTFGGGVSAFDGEHWQTCTTAEGLADNRVMSIAVGPDDAKWFGTWAGGISRYGAGMIVRAENVPKPCDFMILSNSPNPFNPSTTITYTLPSPGKAALAIYDVTGRKVRELAAGNLSAGTHRAVWDGRDANGAAVASGIYFARTTCGNRTATGKMLLLR